MSQSGKKKTDNRLVEKTPSSKAVGRDQRGRRTGFIIASVVIVLILVIIGVFYYLNNVAPLRRTVITVDDTSIRMDYFLKRARLGNVEPMELLGLLAKEQLIKLEAPRYGIGVHPEGINQALRMIARGESESISESEFKAWYRQQLNDSKLSDSEFRDLIATNILAASLHSYLAERVPTVAEQVHLHVILLETYEDAVKTRARWEAGEDFDDLAREVSVYLPFGEQGGDLGWLSRSDLPSGLGSLAFDRLSTGNVSDPLICGSNPLAPAVESEYSETETYYRLLMVSEKADARELDEDSLQAVRSQALDEWLWEETQFHEIKYHGFNNGFDSETKEWIDWQLAKK